MTKENQDDKDKKKDNVTRFPGSDRERQQWYADKNKNEAPPPPKPDHGPLFNLPPATQKLVMFLIAVHIVIHVVVRYLAPGGEMTTWKILYTLGFIPASYTGPIPFDIYAVISPLTHMALHSGWGHLLMNSGMILAFGTILERLVGEKAMMQIFIASGLAGALMHLAFYPMNVQPLIGASGGLSGLFGVMMIIMTEQRGGGKKQLYILAGLWIAISLLFGGIGMGDTQNIAWTAHIGGMFGGMGLFYYWRRKRYR